MIKESLVKTEEYFRNENIDGKLIFQVHDEGVYDLPAETAEDIAKEIQQIWNTTANKYLEGVKMDSEYEVLDYWNK